MSSAPFAHTLARIRLVCLLGMLLAFGGAASADPRIGVTVGNLDNYIACLVRAIERQQLATTVLRDPLAMENGAVDAAAKLAQGQPLQGDPWNPVHLVIPDNHPQFQRL